MYGAGVNLQQCHWMAFAGVGYKFHDVIQAVHRIRRYGQLHPCDVHFVYTEAEREIRREFERKWKLHDETVARMTAIIREYGLARISMAHVLQRSIGCERREVAGGELARREQRLRRRDARMPADSVGLVSPRSRSPTSTSTRLRTTTSATPTTTSTSGGRWTSSRPSCCAR
jgi:hypothetical protein